MKNHRGLRGKLAIATEGSPPGAEKDAKSLWTAIHLYGTELNAHCGK